MATKVDELIVEIKAETAKLKRGLKDVNNQLDKTSKKSSAVVGKLKMIGGAAVLAAVTKLGSSIARVGSGFEDLQDSLNVVFGGMEQGQAAMDRVLEFAQTTPFQIEDATKAFIALKSAGIEPSMDMLQTFADTSSVAVDQLGTFEALVRLTQRSAAGGMGLEELNMISDRGIDVLGILKDRLGLTKDDIAEFGKTAEGAAKMVKALTDGLNEKFGGAMEVKMDNLSTITSNMTIAFRQLADEVFKSGLGDFLKEVATGLGILATEAGRLIRLIGNRQTLSDLGVKGTPEEQIKQLEKLADIQQKIIDESELSKETDYMAFLALDEAEANLENIKNLITSIKRENKMGIFSTIIDGDGTGGGEKFEPDTKFVKFTQAFKKLAADSREASEIIAEQLQLVNEIADDERLLKVFNTTSDEVLRVKGHLEELRDEADNLSDTLSSQLSESITQISMSFTKDFVDSLMDGENALESFKDFSKQIVSTIITTFLQLKVIEPLLNTVFTAFGMPTIPKKAGGGTVQANRPVLVGERGAEIFVPNTSGSIMNHADSKGVGGGGLVVNQQISFSTGVVPTVRAEVSKMLPQIADVTKFAVLEAAQRGGSFRKGLQGA